MVFNDGRETPLAMSRWTEVDRAEPSVMSRVVGPVLDIGCGPGRHVISLARSGIIALGIDSSPFAIAIALSSGAPVLQRSVFDAIPGTGRWGSALLIDGNIGIGGHPLLLLRRVSNLLNSSGCVFIEVEGRGVSTKRLHARIEGEGCRSSWFPWATVGIDSIATVSASSGFVVTDTWQEDNRWFVGLTKRDASL
ncbi:MAG: class I SAM-dependent methyltransferase [Actinomycetota bacterium]